MENDKTNQQDERDEARKLLESLGPMDVVIDGTGRAWQNGGNLVDGFWYRCFGGKPLMSSEDLSALYPITVMVPDRKKTKPRPRRG